MAQFLLCAKALPLAKKELGDVISVVPTSHKFTINEDKRLWVSQGNAEADWPGLHWIVNVLNMPSKEAERARENNVRAATVLDPEFIAPDVEDRIVELSPCRWKVVLPPPMQDELESIGYIEIQYNQGLVNTLFIDKQAKDVFITAKRVRF